MSLLLLFPGVGGGTTVTVVTGHAVLTGKVLTVSQTGHQVINVVTGHVALSGKTLTVTRTEHQVVTVNTGHIVLSGKTLAVTQTLILTLTVQQGNRLKSVLRLHGLVDPLVITPTSRGDGIVVQTMEGTGPVTVTTTTVADTPLLTGTLIDDLARWYGLISPMVENETSRTDGTLSQPVVTVGDTTTMTRL